MTKTFNDVKKLVEKRLHDHVYEDMLTYLMGNPPELWGEKQPEDYLERCFVLLMFKHMIDWGYQRVLQEVKRKHFDLSYKSFKKNSEKIRKVLSVWGESKIKLGHHRDWVRAMRGIDIPDCLSGTLFWMDFFDLKLQNPANYSRKDPQWSYKLNH